MIPIPTERMALRVVKRILALRNGMTTTDTQALGQGIDQAVQTPMNAAAAPDGIEEVILTKALKL